MSICVTSGQPDPPGPRAFPPTARPTRRGTLPLLVFAATNELASNLVLVSVMESAYDVGQGASSVGIVLIVQCVAQLLLGSWAGSIADRFGTRRSAAIGTVAQAVLTAGLILSHALMALYILAFLLMLARLLIVPARLAVVRRVSSRTKLLGLNTVIEVLAGAGLFLGPSIGAALVLFTRQPVMLPAAAGAMFLASALPALFVPAAGQEGSNGETEKRTSVMIQMKSIRGFIRKHPLVRTLLFCRVHSIMLWVAVMPLLASLAHRLGLGSEGTAVLVAALGLGGLAGPILAPAVFKRMRLSLAMLLTGLMAPLSVLALGLTNHVPVPAAFVLLSMVSLGCSGLKVVLHTVLQRLTPDFEQGSLFGWEQAMLGLGWTMALAVVTILTSPAFLPGLGLRTVFLLIGAAGLLVFFSCWLASRHGLAHAPEG